MPSLLLKFTTYQETMKSISLKKHFCPNVFEFYFFRIIFLGRVRFGAADSALDISAPDNSAPGLSGAKTFFFDSLFYIATLFRFVVRFARGRIEDSSFNRFVLNGIQEIACFIASSS